MQETMENFLRALRAAEVHVSPAEAIDAHLTVDAVGYADRQLLKDALCVTLAKSEDEVFRFEDCFEMFFRREEFRAPDENVTGDGEGDGEGELDEGEFGDQPLAQMLLSGDGEAMAREMESAANEVGATNIKFFSQRGYFSRRMLDAMGLRDLERLIARLNRSGEEGDAEMAERLEAGRRYLLDEARSYVERQYELYARANGENLRDEFLTETRLTTLEQRDFERMHKIVRRMAKRLASRYSRRLKHTKRGRLDVRRTLRRSMAHEGIPFETVWKHEFIDKPRIIVICDVSRSVAAAARFLLLLVYSLNEVIAKLNSSAFSDRLIDISDILDNNEVEVAIPEVLEKIGYRSTDYGQALEDFNELFLDKLDRKTTVIMLGDGRSNFTDPRMDLMRIIHDRAKSVIWLNPEPESFWGTGDSEMHKYRRFCHIAKTCSTVADLERVIDDVLKSYIRT